MRFLIKKQSKYGLAVHLADKHGNQLCKTQIKRSDWQIHTTLPNDMFICKMCSRVQARPDRSRHTR